MAMELAARRLEIGGVADPEVGVDVGRYSKLRSASLAATAVAGD
jgi:hypothetical protein